MATLLVSPDSECQETISKKKKEKTKADREYPIGYFYIDIAKVNTEEGRLYIFMVVDRTTKYTYVELHSKQTREIATQSLENSIVKVQYKIQTV